MAGNVKFLKQKYGGFTLMELMIVVIIIGIISAFTIPNYNKSSERAHEKDFIQNLRALHDAELLYRARTDSFWPTDSPAIHSIDDINVNLNLSLYQNGVTYSCWQPAVGSTNFSCTAQRDNTAYAVFLADNGGVPRICCVAGKACPTLATCP